MKIRHPTFLGMEGRQASETAPDDQPSRGCGLDGTFLDGSAWKETQPFLLPWQRDGFAPSPSHPSISLLIESVQIAEKGENICL